MGRKGSGTGAPICFRCAKCKTRSTIRSAKRGMNVLRTGKTRPAGCRGQRMLAVASQYRCLDCGHEGWSRHVDVARLPLTARP